MPAAIDPAKKRYAVELLADGRMNLRNVAMRVGIAYATLHWWTYQPEFQHELDLERKRIIQHAGTYINKEQRLIALSSIAEMARKQYEEHQMLVETRTMGGVSTTIERPNEPSFTMFLKAVAEIGKLMGDYKPQVQVTQSSTMVGLTVNVPQMTAEALKRYVKTEPEMQLLPPITEDDDGDEYEGSPEFDGSGVVDADC